MQNPQLEITEPRHIHIVDGGMPHLGPTQIRIRTERSLISAGTEGSSFTGRPWQHVDGRPMPEYPARVGYSNGGVVVEIGAEVKNYEVGDPRDFERHGAQWGAAGQAPTGERGGWWVWACWACSRAST